MNTLLNKRLIIIKLKKLLGITPEIGAGLKPDIAYCQSNLLPTSNENN